MRLLQEVPVVHVFFFRMLRVADVPQTAVLGLPLAYAVGALVNMGFLGYYLRRMDGGEAFRLGVFAPFLRDIAGASALAGAASYGVLQVSAPLFNGETFLGIFLQGFLAGICGVAAAVAFLYVRGTKELQEVQGVLGRKFWRRQAVGPEPEHL